MPSAPLVVYAPARQEVGQRALQDTPLAIVERTDTMIRTILVPLTAELSSEPRLNAALVLARRVNAHIRALFIFPNPDALLAIIPEAAGVTREVIERDTREAAAKEKERFIGWRTRENLPETAGERLDTCFATWTSISARSSLR
jgi:hypothetical protein